MIDNKKVISLYVSFSDEYEKKYVMVEIDDTEKAKQIAKKWAEKIVGKESETVVIHQGIIDAPAMEPEEVFKGYRIWELPF